MKTGEGKTLVATLPSYLNALAGRGVLVVTVNDYLANRDAEWMGQVHRFLGLSVGVVLNSMTPDQRRENYNCDITYVTNNELGFDYLRDNMSVYAKQLVLRELYYAIIDEVDSVLIDEARTPLIISGASAKSTELYRAADEFVRRRLKRGADLKDVSKMDIIMGVEEEESGDFNVNEKDRNVILTASGIEKVEKQFGIENLSDPENLELQHHIDLALRANYLMHRDQEYVVKDDEIFIVDEHTGRIMPGRRYSDGLHQAIEAKEHVKVRRESKTLATITLQNFFNKFEKKAGMTGTALTEELEFRNIYGMDVIEVPTNLPMIRNDMTDLVYKTKREKLNAVVESIISAHEKEATLETEAGPLTVKGQPVLVGTITIEASEELSSLLKKRGIRHNVLNAKFHEMEAGIVAEAGRHGAITIATNMAGRGTDIKLDDESRALGGLKIVGTERHESRRIDNQLRGRSGRQGDPGESRFFISLEDDLMRLFGGERMISIFNMLKIPENQELEHKSLSNTIRNAQKKIESNNYGMRKNLLEFDQVANEQREIIYAERKRVLHGENMRDSILKMVNETVESVVSSCVNDDQDPDDWELKALDDALMPIVPLKPTHARIEIKREMTIVPGSNPPKFAEKVTANLVPLSHEDAMAALNVRIGKPDKATLISTLKDEAIALYVAKEADFPEPDMMREAERVMLLRSIDRRWMNHIDDIEQLRQGAGLAAWGQRDPIVEYRQASYEMFTEMVSGIREDTVRLLMHLRVQKRIEREQVAKATGTNKDSTGPKAPMRRAAAKIGPNDPCPCGSGKKYKKCCMLKEA